MIESASTTLRTISSPRRALSPSSRSAATRMRASGERRSWETPSSIARSCSSASLRRSAIARSASPSRSISRAPRTRLPGSSPRAMPSICRTSRDTGAATQRLIKAATTSTTPARPPSASSRRAPVLVRLQAADDPGPAADAAALGDAQPGHRRVGGVVEPDLLHLDAGLGQGPGQRRHPAVVGQLDRLVRRLAAQDLDVDLHLAPGALAGGRRRRRADRLGPERRERRGGGAVLVGAEDAAERPTSRRSPSPPWRRRRAGTSASSGGRRRAARAGAAGAASAFISAAPTGSPRRAR